MRSPDGSEAEGSLAAVTCLSGPRAGERFAIPSDGLAFGRTATMGVELRDAAVSRQHCRIELDGARHVLVDLQSRHGTFVNRDRVERRPLADGDRFAVGRSAFVFHAAAAARPGEGTVSIEMSDMELWLDGAEHVSVDGPGLLDPARVAPVDDGSASSAASSLAVLRRMGDVLGEMSGAEELAGVLLELLFEAIPAERGGVIVFSDTPREAGTLPGFDLVVTRSRGAEGDERVRLSRTVITRAVLERTALLANGVLDTPEWSGSESLDQGRVRSVLCTPLVLFERSVGVLYLDSSAPHARFGDGHLELAVSAGAMAAMPLLAARRDALRALVVGPSLAPLPPEAPSVDPGTGRPVLVVFRPDGPLHVGEILRVGSGLALTGAQQTRALLLDQTVPRGLGHRLDRLAILAPETLAHAASVADAPAVSRLALHLASTSGLGERADLGDGREWIAELLLVAGILASRARRVVVESLVGEGNTTGSLPADRGAAVSLARKAAHRLGKATGVPLTSPHAVATGLPEFQSLDGEGPMGRTPKGALFLTDTSDQLARKIRTAKTDQRVGLDPSVDLSPTVRNLVLLLHAASNEPVEAILARFEGRGYGELKEALLEAVESVLEPLRRRRADLAEDPGTLTQLSLASKKLDAEGVALMKGLS